MNNYHIPVMPEETLKFLDVQKGHWYIDCNLGGGGHTEKILQMGGKVLGVDLDPEAITEVAQKYHLDIQQDNNNLRAYSNQLILFQDNFSYLKDIVKAVQISQVSGILFDLGVSSHQLESGERGFSFNIEAPLDMRMDPTHQQVTATDLINVLSENELAKLFFEYGEERFGKAIAKKIIRYRQNKKLENTNELANLITSIRPRSKTDRTHPATRVFQALRITVNDELKSLEQVLPQALDILGPEGRLVIISFHSLEDRIVKNFLQEEERKNHLQILTPKPINPGEEEIEKNPRSRSGKLRAAIKTHY